MGLLETTSALLGDRKRGAALGPLTWASLLLLAVGLVQGCGDASSEDEPPDEDGSNSPRPSSGAGREDGADECALSECGISNGSFVFSYSCGTGSTGQTLDYEYDEDGQQIGVVALTTFANGNEVTCERQWIEQGVYMNACYDGTGAECTW